MMVLILMQGINRGHKLIVLLMMAVVFFGVNYYLFVIKKLPCGLALKK
jgi:L-lysine 2,3-aminomutase